MNEALLAAAGWGAGIVVCASRRDSCSRARGLVAAVTMPARRYDSHVPVAV